MTFRSLAVLALVGGCGRFLVLDLDEISGRAVSDHREVRNPVLVTRRSPLKDAADGRAVWEAFGGHFAALIRNVLYCLLEHPFLEDRR